jgi:sulfonate transport system ATP-binding protein
VSDSRSVLFQDSRLLPWESVLRNVTLGLRVQDADQRGRAALADVGLAGREDAWPNLLSGGEQQRVALARSLVRQPALLLADEPFGALDALTRLRMHELLFRLVERHRPTVLMVTHDVDEALVLADRVLVMEQGRIILDQAVGLPHPRRKTGARFASLRGDLLSALGVVVEV